MSWWGRGGGGGEAPRRAAGACPLSTRAWGARAIGHPRRPHAQRGGAGGPYPPGTRLPPPAARRGWGRITHALPVVGGQGGITPRRGVGPRGHTTAPRAYHARQVGMAGTGTPLGRQEHHIGTVAYATPECGVERSCPPQEAEGAGACPCKGRGGGLGHGQGKGARQTHVGASNSNRVCHSRSSCARVLREGVDV